MTEPTRTYAVKGMDCKSCADTLEQGIGKLNGVNGVRIDFMTSRIHVDGDVSFDELRRRANTLGHYDLINTGADVPAPADTPAASGSGVVGFLRYMLGERPTQFALAGAAVTLLGLALALALAGVPGAANALYVLGVVIAVYPIARSGITNLLINRSFNLNMLMTLAAVGALVIGETLEAAVVVIVFAIGEALEGFTSDRARESIRALGELAPAAAHLLHDGETHAVPVGELRVNDVILVKPGERVPMDGAVISGESAVNQSPITGESIPVSKMAGAEVYAGTINGDGALTVRVTQIAEDNTLSRIIKLVEEAQNVRAPSQRRIDQFAAYYTPAMVILALLVASVPPLLFGAPFFEPVGGHGWLYRALVLLVIACPCSLVISTPVAVVSAITTAARRGVLIKGGLHLETLGKVKAFAFDKTGTLTEGKPQVTHYRAVTCASPNGCDECNAMLAFAASVEQQSSHPLAQAVVSAAANITPHYTAQGVTSLSGRGVQGQVNGHTITVGSHRLFDECFPHSPALCAAVTEREQHGETAMLVAEDERVLGVIAAADTPREHSRETVLALNDLGVATVMLTGDNATVAEAVAAQVGVTDVRAGLLPADKAQAVGALGERYGTVAMVGDGVNDTPALAASAVGIAMGGAGTAQAVETADIALMGDDLRQLPYTLRLARFTTALITQNIGASVGVKALFMLLALGGITSLWLAIFADVGMLLLVTLNGMRPLRFR